NETDPMKPPNVDVSGSIWNNALSIVFIPLHVLVLAPFCKGGRERPPHATYKRRKPEADGKKPGV
ncbi:MAG: hypothetical protein OXG54_09135, partial [Gammaproteobacteria bacterium]|nr:hypothetical protein [Gammaproteobacteria bacterium]